MSPLMIPPHTLLKVFLDGATEVIAKLPNAAVGDISDTNHSKNIPVNPVSPSSEPPRQQRILGDVG